MSQHFSFSPRHGSVLSSKPRLERDRVNKQLFDENEVRKPRAAYER